MNVSIVYHSHLKDQLHLLCLGSCLEPMFSSVSRRLRVKHIRIE